MPRLHLLHLLCLFILLSLAEPLYAQGDFKGMTSGLGPVLGYIQPLGTQSLAVESSG